MQHALDLIVKTTYKYMNSFHWKKIIEDSINDRLIITATTTEIFFALKAANAANTIKNISRRYEYHERC